MLVAAYYSGNDVAGVPTGDIAEQRRHATPHSHRQHIVEAKRCGVAAKNSPRLPQSQRCGRRNAHPEAYGRGLSRTKQIYRSHRCPHSRIRHCQQHSRHARDDTKSQQHRHQLSPHEHDARRIYFSLQSPHTLRQIQRYHKHS